MIEKIEYKGLWFLPSNVDRKIHGILKYDYDNNISILELLGSFYDYSNHDGEDIILGISSDGDELTLTDCYFKSSTGLSRENSPIKPIRKADKLATLNFGIRNILKGFHIHKKENLVFQKAYIEIFNLDEWIGISGIESNNAFDDTKIISFESPESINANINDDLSIEIKFLSNYPIGSRFTKELKLKQRTIFAFHSKSYKTIEEFFYLIRKFNYFLSCSTQKPLRIESMELYSDKFTRKISGDNTISKAIKVSQIINPELQFSERKQDWEMLFTYKNIKNDFENIMQKWFHNYEKFEAPFNLVLSQYYVSKYYLENLFINVAQAAESFHRRIDLVDDTPKEQQDIEFQNKVDRILEVAPEDLKNWVESRIKKPKHFYDTRLKYILKEFSNDELDKMIGDQNKFVKDIVKSRNYYTHYNKEQKKGAANGVELIRLYQKLRLLLICGFLIESGFDKGLLEKLIKEKSNNLFNHLLN